MVRRFKKKSRYMRGSRTCGWGRVGQHRKSGSSGGRGKSGRHKHKWTWVLKYAEDSSGYPFFGKHGFIQPPPLVPRRAGINVGELDAIIDDLVRKGLAELKEGKYYVDLLKLGYNKLLGGGKVTKPIIVKTVWATRKAEEKIRAAGGAVEFVRGVVHA